MKTNETSVETHYYTIDPPSGWKYGFPKSVTETEYKSITNFKQWCIDNGYPEKEANDLGEYFHVGISGPIPVVQVKKSNQKQFKSGDYVCCLKSCSFTDGSYHEKGKTYFVTEETEAYYNVCSKDYKLATNQKQYKQFDETLFKAYINKFSDEDKLKALKVLVCDISTTDPKLNTLLNQISAF